MPVLQRILNLPLLLPGFGIKLLFFAVKGYGKEYAAGIKNGLALCRKPENRGKKSKIPFPEPEKLSEDPAGTLDQSLPPAVAVRRNLPGFPKKFSHY